MRYFQKIFWYGWIFFISLHLFLFDWGFTVGILKRALYSSCLSFSQNSEMFWKAPVHPNSHVACIPQVHFQIPWLKTHNFSHICTRCVDVRCSVLQCVPCWLHPDLYKARDLISWWSGWAPPPPHTHPPISLPHPVFFFKDDRQDRHHHLMTRAN